MDINEARPLVQAIQQAQATAEAAKVEYQKAYEAWNTARISKDEAEGKKDAAVLALFGLTPSSTVQIICPHGWNGDTRVFKGPLAYGRLVFSRDAKGNINETRAVIRQGKGRRSMTKSGALVMNDAQRQALQVYIEAFEGGAK